MSYTAIKAEDFEKECALMTNVTYRSTRNRYPVPVGYMPYLQAQSSLRDCMKKGNERANVKKKSLIHTAYRLSLIITFVFVLTCGASIEGFAFFGFGDTSSWKEEVLLHDGNKIIVKRWQKQMIIYGQKRQVLEYSLSFQHPETGKTIIWKDGPTFEIQDSANFSLVALHIKDKTPYLIMKPYFCLAFNKWGRPDPPYVIFKYEGDEWKRIPLSALPPEFKNINLVISTIGYDGELLAEAWFPVSAEKIQELNASLTNEEYKTIVRTPIKKIGPEGCPEMFYYGRGWMGLGEFKEKASYESCMNHCRKNLFPDNLKYCPCDRLFNNKTKGE